MMSASGSMMGSRSLISLSSMRQNATTGAPVRSEPKLGKACAWRPSSNAATDNISVAVTTPCPPRPCMRIWNMSPPSNIGIEKLTLSPPECQPTSRELSRSHAPDWQMLYQSMGHPTQNRSRECGAEKRAAHLFHTPDYRRATRRLGSSHGWCSCHLLRRQFRKNRTVRHLSLIHISEPTRL